MIDTDKRNSCLWVYKTGDYGYGLQSIDSEACHLGGYWASHLNTLWLGFIICNVRTIIILRPRPALRIEWDYKCEVLSSVSRLINCSINVSSYYLAFLRLNIPCEFLVLGLKVITPTGHMLNEWGKIFERIQWKVLGIYQICRDGRYKLSS